MHRAGQAAAGTSGAASRGPKGGIEAGLQWGAPVQAALKAMLDALRQSGSVEAPAAGAAAPDANGHAHANGHGQAADGATAAAASVLCDEYADNEHKLAAARGVDAAALATRQLQQLRPACVKLLKELIMHTAAGAAGKTD
jgi:hypothetical protein